MGYLQKGLTEVECWEPKGLAQMMKMAQRVENREVTKREAKLKMNSEGKSQSTLPYNKVTNSSKLSENKYKSTISMRIITLRGTLAIENWRDGSVNRLTNVEFQEGGTRDSIFVVIKSIMLAIDVKFEKREN